MRGAPWRELAPSGGGGWRKGRGGREGALALDGELTTGLIGADIESERWLAGLAAGHSRGTGGYRMEGTCTGDNCSGEVEASLTGLYPYAGLDLTERLSVWASAGHGAGEVTLTPDGQSALTADLTLTMGAAGIRNDLLAPETQGTALAVKADARFTRTSSDAVEGPSGRLEAADADVWQVRVGVEGSRAFALHGDGGPTPPPARSGERACLAISTISSPRPPCGESGPAEGRAIRRRGRPTRTPSARGACRRDCCARRRPRPCS